MSFESSPKIQKVFYVEDHEGTSYYNLLKKMPPELGSRHAQAIEEGEMSESEALNYIEDITSARKEAKTETYVSEPEIQKYFENSKKIPSLLETEVFTSTDNELGSGQTAKIKRFDLETDEKTLPLAIKYVITPTENTISPSSEHNMILEVERIRSIEQANANMEHMRVPHPYFHHQSESVQCYGMEMIDGIDLTQDIASSKHDTFREDLVASGILERSESEVFAEVERFFEKVHKHCLHRDIKRRNIMVNKDGVFYLIDFGESVPLGTIHSKARPQAEKIQEDEVTQAKSIIRNFISALRSTVR